MYPSTPKIDVQGAGKTYPTSRGTLEALADVSLTIPEGQFCCLLGPSGSGKTTLLWAMAGLHPLTTGRILLNGREVTGPQPKHVGVVFQEANLLPWRSVEQNVEFPFELGHRPPDRDRISALLSAAGLESFRQARPAELSGGMRQRVSIVRALAQDPDVLLMDEPFSALDAFTRQEMELLLLKLWEESRKTVVFVTHNIGEAVFLADTVVVMSARPGRVEKQIDIRLPRPRHEEMTYGKEYVELTREIKASVDTGARRGWKQGQ
jgi:NitT/TauT family transport system ATP-binding protein